MIRRIQIDYTGFPDGFEQRAKTADRRARFTYLVGGLSILIGLADLPLNLHLHQYTLASSNIVQIIIAAGLLILIRSSQLKSHRHSLYMMDMMAMNRLRRRISPF